MMAPVNALCATEGGAKYFEQWMKNFQKSGKLESEGNFSDFEKIAGNLYTIKDEGWKIGKMGRSVDFFDVLGLTVTGTTLPFKLSSESKVLDFWADLSSRLYNKEGAVIYSDNHYRAVVGTYIDESTKQRGLIIRDSSGAKEVRISLDDLRKKTTKTDQLNVTYFSRPKQPPQAQALEQSLRKNARKNL